MICHIFALVHEHLHGDDYLGPSEGIRGPATQSHASENQKLGASSALERDVNGEVPHEVVVYAVGGGGDLRGMSEGARSSSGGGGRNS